MAPIRSAKEGKPRTLRVTVFPKEGGRPFTTDVQPDEQGTFQVQERGTFQVARGSVWEEAGILRAIVNEGNPQTLSAYSFTGDDSMNPIALHGIASNNLWIQLDTLAKRKSVWKNASTWGIIAIGVVLCLLILWQVKTIGGGFDDLQASLDALRMSGGSLGGEGAAQQSAQQAAGHIPISERP